MACQLLTQWMEAGWLLCSMPWLAFCLSDCTGQDMGLCLKPVLSRLLRLGVGPGQEVLVSLTWASPSLQAHSVLLLVSFFKGLSMNALSFVLLP